MKLSILIPAHNEERTIRQILDRVINSDTGLVEKEIIIIDDGSTDRTWEYINTWFYSLKEKNHIEILTIHNQENMGKGAALQSGFKKISGDYMIIQDADLEYNPDDFREMLNTLSKEKVSAVFGARGHKVWPKRGFHYVIGAWLLTTTFNILFRQKLTDLYTGYKLINVSSLRAFNIESVGFEFEAEISCKLVMNRSRIVEIPISYNPRNKDQGKHIRFIDAVKGFYTILRLWIKRI